MIEYLSFGGGPPSAALLILNAWGEITPKADIVVWADTGWEKQATYDALPWYENFACEMGLEWIEVTSRLGPLQEYVLNKSAVIPVHTETGIGRRQCTDKWKIEPIERELHRRFGNTGLTAQLAMTREEAHRMRDPRVKRNRNRWPLIEKRLGRDDCIEIIKMAQLPVPPYSACKGCPMQNHARWREEASRHPNDFREAVEMDKQLGPNKWLHWSRQPLDKIYSLDQLAFPLGNDGQIESCSDANCFT